MNVVWPGVVVESSNLPVQIAALRRVLDEGRPNGSCIQTVPGRGYRFVAPVTSAETVTAASFSRSASGPIAVDEEPELLSAVCPIDGLSPAPKPGAPPRHRRAVIASIAAGAVCLAVIVFAAMNWRSLSPWADGSPPRLSIVVLPFANLSNDPGQQYFADALTEDLTIEISRIAEMFVISSGTAFTYRNKPVDTKQIGRELGVRYVLEGSLQRSSDRLRVNLQLIDAATNAHLWAERLDHDISDLFTLQDEITARIAAALDRKLIDAEAARPVEHADALDYILRGRAAWNIRPTSDHYAKAIHLFEQALALDPRSVEARKWLADVLVNRVLQHDTETADADISRSEKLVEQVLATSPLSPQAHFVKGQILRTQHRCKEAITEFETAISLNPNLAYAYADLGWCKFVAGSIDEGLQFQEKAIRLGPRDPFVRTLYFRIGLMNLLLSHIQEAIGAFEKAHTTSERDTAAIHAFLAATYALQGQSERAATELAEARRLDADGHYSSIARAQATLYFKSAKIEALYESTFLLGLRKAGMPEE